MILLTHEVNPLESLGFSRNMTHPAPVTPTVTLEQFGIGLNREHIHSVQVPEAEAYWRNPKELAVPDEKAPDSCLWDMADARQHLYYGFALTCERRFAPLTDARLASAMTALNVARQRLGINPGKLTTGETFEKLVNNWFEEVYAAMVPRFRNPSLTEYVMRGGGAADDKSECAHSLLLTVPGGCALEGAYGFGLNLFGMYQQIGPEDPMALWVPNAELTTGDLGFRFERKRSREFLGEFQDADKVISLGAGWLPEVRHAEMILGEMPDFKGKTLIACDKDPKIPREMFGEWEANSGLRIIYKASDIAESLPILIHDHAGTVDLVYAKGVMSFMPQKIGPVLGAVLPMLRSGGKFKFDLQIDHDIFRRDILLFSWGGALTEGKLHLMERNEAMKVVADTMVAVRHQTQIDFDWIAMLDDEDDPMGMFVSVIKH